MYSWQFCWRWLTVYVRIFFFPIVFSVMFHWLVYIIVLYHLAYCSFIMSFEIRKCEMSDNCVLLAQDFSDSWWFLWVYMNFRIVMYILKFHWNSDRNCIESIDQFGNFNSVKSTSPLAWDISIYLCFSSVLEF